jgi:hypothetical protein
MAAFITLKKNLTAAPVIVFPRKGRTYEVYCDAATGSTGDDGNIKYAGGLGSVLVQRDLKDRPCIIAYASRALKDHERNYTAFMLEMAAIHYGIKHFHHYLYGGPKFKVYTDHRPLETLSKNQTKTLSRLQENLMEYSYEIIYKPGNEMGAPDFLSRNMNPTNLSQNEALSALVNSRIYKLRINSSVLSTRLYLPDAVPHLLNYGLSKLSLPWA